MTESNVFSYNLTLPEDVNGLTIPNSQVRCWDTQIFVYDICVSENHVIRHYQFYDQWFEIRCNLTPDGDYVTAAGPIDWCFHIDICSPCFSFEENTYHVDLCRHILVGPDGLTHVVIDTGDFDYAIQQNWITEEEKLGAENGLAAILEIILNGRLLEFLEMTCSFYSVEECLIQLSLVSLPFETFPLLQIGERQKHFGIRS